ncbi:MAG TPA: hypothetical protein VN227_00275 [Methanoregula sp.]|nr:hypothetical protein [Methanoregula sp.]
MSATQSQGSCIVFRTPQTKQISRTGSRPASAGNSLSPAVMDKTNLEMLNRFGELFLETGIDINQEEIHELRLLDEFLARHVQPNGIYDVQCMLLWSEWVRTFRSKIRGFPKLIRENEFRSVITEKFGLAIAENGFRGAVYPGIRFVP